MSGGRGTGPLDWAKAMLPSHELALALVECETRARKEELGRTLAGTQEIFKFSVTREMTTGLDQHIGATG